MNEEYSQLEKKWDRLLNKFASWNIEGVSPDDIKQELRIVLWKAMNSYNTNMNTKFGTYLYAAFQNLVRKLHKQVYGTGSRIPPDRVDYINPNHAIDYASEEIYMIDTFCKASPEAKHIVSLILDGEKSKRSWRYHGLTSKQIEEGTEEIKEMMKGDI